MAAVKPGPKAADPLPAKRWGLCRLLQAGRGLLQQRKEVGGCLFRGLSVGCPTSAPWTFPGRDSLSEPGHRLKEPRAHGPAAGRRDLGAFRTTEVAQPEAPAPPAGAHTTQHRGKAAPCTRPEVLPPCPP